MTPLDPRTDALIRAIIEGFTDVSGKFIAAHYPPRDVAPQHAQLDIDDPTPAQPLHGQVDAENGHRAVVSVTDGEGVSIAVKPDNDTLDWLSDMTDADSVNVVNAMLPKPVNGREKRLSRLRQAPADTSPKGTGAVGVKWVDGELDKVLTLSKERQKVWRWLKGLTVTPSEPSCWDAAAETGISQQTANKAIKQYRDFHGIF